MSSSVSDFERLFKTSINMWKHQISGRLLPKAEGYHVPADLQYVVESLVGIAELPLRPQGLKKQQKKQTREELFGSAGSVGGTESECAVCD